MGVDYDAVAGVGLRIDDAVFESLLKSKLFTFEEWAEDQEECICKVGLQYSQSGNMYSGDTEWILFVNGETLGEILENAPAFLKRLSNLGINIKLEDLEIIDDLLIS